MILFLRNSLRLLCYGKFIWGPSDQQIFGIYTHLEKLRLVQLERPNKLVQTRPILLKGEFYIRANFSKRDRFCFSRPNFIL